MRRNASEAIGDLPAACRSKNLRRTCAQQPASTTRPQSAPSGSGRTLYQGSVGGSITAVQMGAGQLPGHGRPYSVSQRLGKSPAEAAWQACFDCEARYMPSRRPSGYWRKRSPSRICCARAVAVHMARYPTWSGQPVGITFYLTCAPTALHFRSRVRGCRLSHRDGVSRFGRAPFPRPGRLPPSRRAQPGSSLAAGHRRSRRAAGLARVSTAAG